MNCKIKQQLNKSFAPISSLPAYYNKIKQRTFGSGRDAQTWAIYCTQPVSFPALKVLAV